MDILKLSQLASLSYEDENKFRESITDTQDITFYSIRETQFYVLEYENLTIITIRGTSNFRDGLSDIYVSKSNFDDVKNENIYVHNGFLTQYNFVKLIIFDIVVKKPNKHKIIFTSHSLGASISTLLSTMLKTYFKDNIIVENITFGCPKIGNTAFVDYYSSIIDKSLNYQYNNDIITMIPKIGYTKFKNIIHLENGTHSFIHNTFGNIEDHHIDNYVNYFKNNPDFIENTI